MRVVVVIEDLPVLIIKDLQTIVRVEYTALCGHQPSPTEHCGRGGRTDQPVKKGDSIVSPFTCFYRRGETHHEYVRVPLADSTVVKAPPEIEKNALVLMADIFPTGGYCSSQRLSSMTQEEIAGSTVVVIGCGPVGLCALVNAEEYKPKHLFAVDSIQSRLDLAKSLGAEPLNSQTDREGLQKIIKEVTQGRRAEVVIEVVLRPWGLISNVGVHNGEMPVQTRLPQAKQHLLGFMWDKMIGLSV
ncbi:uncharacterized protein K452DRAFT_328000 [Aplosporella prunicola CBS 121167]|uniref:Alcohol dehydrogenase-like C-terminal domain-containing protein n=1 Tax=Aplosporella prunicola CBS 121167 TaxID=1176127 RepID=A0A6A6B9E5_9PEZI|nr:uncharacterized protein K452DRAFT_328000 [Aplosporella prunicola CBS 121167]KAF2139537.1 hypothetical protein K452DRAFT_328000 [Aplosporella prunicola CBS 121167]